MDSHFGLKPEHVVTDAGYDNEENLDWLRGHEYKPVIKSSQYEIRKTRAVKERIWLPANMPYDPEKDEHTCAKGRRLVLEKIRKTTLRSGYTRESYVYRCTNCHYC